MGVIKAYNNTNYMDIEITTLSGSYGARVLYIGGIGGAVAGEGNVMSGNKNYGNIYNPNTGFTSVCSGIVSLILELRWLEMGMFATYRLSLLVIGRPKPLLGCMEITHFNIGMPRMPTLFPPIWNRIDSLVN